LKNGSVYNTITEAGKLSGTSKSSIIKYEGKEFNGYIWKIENFKIDSPKRMKERRLLS